MRVLLLGGTGAMGEHLVSILSKRKIYVSITTRGVRKSDNHYIQYIEGNAHDLFFIQSILENENNKYDAIVDFMHYSTSEFKERYQYLLSHTEHYLYLSSARVYAQSNDPITEKSPRLLDVCQDELYLSTDDYALAKARQEDLITKSGFENYTIIRPFITFSEQRLQLGVFEKEDWLFRVFKGNPIVFSKDIASHFTTLTYGLDVSTAIAGMICNEQTKGDVFHVTTNKCLKWEEIASLYQKVLSEHFGYNVELIFSEKCFFLDSFTSQWAVKYSRYFDYQFDNSKICSIIPELSFTDTMMGLEYCLKNFLQHPNFKKIHPYIQARMDRESGALLPLSTWPSLIDKARYLFYRFAPIKIIKKRLN